MVTVGLVFEDMNKLVLFYNKIRKSEMYNPKRNSHKFGSC